MVLRDYWTVLKNSPSSLQYLPVPWVSLHKNLIKSDGSFCLSFYSSQIEQKPSWFCLFKMSVLNVAELFTQMFSFFTVSWQVLWKFCSEFPGFCLDNCTIKSQFSVCCIFKRRGRVSCWFWGGEDFPDSWSWKGVFQL